MDAWTLKARRVGLGLGLWALCLGLMGSVCPPQRYHAVNLAPSNTRQAWERVLADWTREHRVYDWSDDMIYARATFHSPAFRKGYIDHRSEFFGYFSDQANKELLELGFGEVENFHSFFVSAYVGKQRYKALTHSHTIWSLYLENNEGVKVKAEKFRDIRITQSVAAMYPYVDRFDKAYLVRFPLADADGKPVITGSTRAFTLHIASNYAHAQLKWELVPGAAPQEFGIPRDGGLPPDAGSLEDKLGGFGSILGN